MDFHLTEDQLAMQEMARKFSKNEIAPLAETLDVESRFPAENFAKMADLGLLGVVVPEAYGGVGQSILTCCVVMEEIAYSCPATALSFLVHAVLVGHNMSCNASEEQKQRYLPDICAGKKIGAIAMTEPGYGSDVLSMQTFAERKGDEYIINGSKTFITNAPVADVFLVYVRTDKDAGPRGLSQFIVDRDAPGLTIGQPFKKMGLRGSPTAQMFFEDCRVPVANLVRGENKALGILLGGLDVERTVGACMGVGGLRAALDKSVAYTLERQQFGQPLFMHEMVAEKLANMSMDLEAAKMLTYKAACLCDEGVQCPAEAAHAKLFASEAFMRAASETVQILGGYGYMQEYGAERMMRDAKLGTIGGGTSEIQRILIAREVIKGAMQMG
ncbi:MAG: Isovaleryl-CoA dehydrogenase [Candidatus Hydrogenedentes bacterium]|nr:Isovaleryl-CoA dehydrogenase [Candidatus Hydrogenedentota bacterium]